METTVAFALGGGNLAAKGLALVRSISEFSENCEVVATVPSTETKSIPPTVRKEVASTATIVESEPPIDGYPIAIKIEALRQATKLSDTESYVLLDTDTLVFSDLTGLTRSELCVRPANFTSRRREVGMGEVLTKTLYESHGFAPPGRTLRGAVDGAPMLPCWNAGVVATTDTSLPGRWLNLTRELIEKLQHRRFADQAALALLSTELDTTVLPILDNYPGSFRFRFPSSIRILHYHNFRHTARVLNPNIRRKFRAIGLSEIIRDFVDEPIVRGAIKHTLINIFHRLRGW